MSPVTVSYLQLDEQRFDAERVGELFVRQSGGLPPELAELVLAKIAAHAAQPMREATD